MDFGNMLGLNVFGQSFVHFGVGIVIALIVAYIYFALVMQTLGKKLKVGNEWMAWVPIVNMFYIPMLAGYEWYYGFLWLLLFIPIIGGPIVLIIAIWWWWKIAEKRNFPGWLSILLIIPVINIILPGVFAWYDVKKKTRKE